MAKYIYPARFLEEDGGYSVSFPDLRGCYTCGDNLADAFEMAKDVLPLFLISLEDDGAPIPEPSDINALPAEAGSFVSYIDADTDVYRRTVFDKSVKKTISMPAWLSREVEKEGISLSKFVQDALIEELGLSA